MTDASKSAWYPLLGYRHSSGGDLKNVDSDGFYWSCKTSGGKGIALQLIAAGVSNSTFSSDNSTSMPVRCVKE